MARAALGDEHPQTKQAAARLAAFLAKYGDA